MSLVRTRVKMCGMTRIEDIEYAAHLGVDALGFIFYQKSSRCISIDQARSLLESLPPFIDSVAVLVNPEVEFVTRLINELPIHCLQFHGDESPDFCQQFSKPFIKAIHPHSPEHIGSCMNDFKGAQALLLDTPSASVRGGSGLSFDWQIIPKNLPKPYILAGGLNEFNVKEAIKSVHPYAVDVCSGIEVAPGIKDPLKMKRFIKRLWDRE